MRHDRIFLEPGGWAAILDATPALQDDPEVTRWAAAGWPLVRRRRLREEPAAGVPLGLPLPPAAGRRRLALSAPEAAVAASLPALDLAHAAEVAPHAWQPTLAALLQAADRHRQRVQVFGSLAWASITGLPYLTPGSDLDVMLAVVPPARPAAFLEALDAVAGEAPMRIDAEIVRPDGAAMPWREARGTQALVKHEAGAALMSPACFLAGRAP